ncbi:MAG: nucleotidyltransferase domain-containing protein [Desulfobacterales bacterium]|nr:nucleotidyltransferase domain-containing protein [Desulfobacterales bacterium]MDD4072197.1 nucleotidyltransferase domain-containing protein [Desulfobacterales bacterium]MDD4393076.1 nucleotidyltransferase domain-containing protein [Desulfobacterales bacterium]
MTKKDEILLHLRRFKGEKKERYTILKMGIFGSAARDDMTAESDIDVVVELGKTDLFYLNGIKQELEEQLHRKVDIVRYRDSMNAFLKKRIDKEAVYV